MRKRLVTPTPESIPNRGEGWLDVERAAVVEFTSEDQDYPVESIFAFRIYAWLASGGARESNHSAGIRPAAKTQLHIARVRGK